MHVGDARGALARAARWLCCGSCAARGLYPPPQALNAPVKPLDEAREDRLGEVADDSSEAAAAGVRGLTFEEFHHCMMRKPEIKSTQGRLADGSLALDTRKKSIHSEDLALDELRHSINPANGGAVDAYNARLLQQHELVRVFNTRVERSNGEVEKGRTERRAYWLGCADRPFRVTDIERLPTELQAVAREDISDFDLPAYFTGEPRPRSKAAGPDLVLSYCRPATRFIVALLRHGAHYHE